MTNIASVCGACGSTELGTRFCERCGAPVEHQPLVVSPVVLSAPIPPAVRATPARAATLVFFLLAELGPGWFQLAGAQSTVYQPEIVRGFTAGLIGLTGLFALISALAGSAGPAGKLFGAVFALAYTGSTIFLLFGFYGDLITTLLVLGVASASLFLSWGLGRPFRGPGYLGLLVLLVVSVLVGFLPFVPGIQSSAVLWLAAISAATALALWIVVGSSIALERRRMMVTPHE